MPFTIGGDYIPSKEPEKPKRTRVRLQKRRNSFVTEIIDLNLSPSEVKSLAQKIKRELGVGGTSDKDRIEIQGSKVEEVKKILQKDQIKFQ